MNLLSLMQFCGVFKLIISQLIFHAENKIYSKNGKEFWPNNIDTAKRKLDRKKKCFGWCPSSEDVSGFYTLVCDLLLSFMYFMFQGS